MYMVFFGMKHDMIPPLSMFQDGKELGILQWGRINKLYGQGCEDFVDDVQEVLWVEEIFFNKQFCFVLYIQFWKYFD